MSTVDIFYLILLLLRFYNKYMKKLTFVMNISNISEIFLNKIFLILFSWALV